MKRHFSILPLVLFTFSGLLLLYFGWAFLYAYQYISESIASGQLVVSGNEFEIVNFYMMNSAQYLIYAILLFSLGWLLRKPAAMVREPSNEVRKTASPGKDEEDLDDWFAQMEQENRKD